MYDAVSNRFLKHGANGLTHFNVPTNNAVMLVLVPSGGTEMMVGRRLVVDDVVIDYNAALLPDNLVRNPDVDAPQFGTATTASFWHRSPSTVWSDDVALSPTHSLHLNDNSETRTDEWRSYATAIPEGEDRAFQVRWFWKYDIEPGSEFLARLRLSTRPASGSDLTNPTTVMVFPISGMNDVFEMFETTLDLPDAIRSFDLTFISGGVLSALGTLFVDDVSAAPVTTPLAGDYNGDGTVDAADYVVWRKSLGQTGPNLAADGNNSGTVDQADYDHWRAAFGQSSTGLSATTNIPEPTTLMLVLVAAVGFSPMTRCLSSLYERLR